MYVFTLVKQICRGYKGWMAGLGLKELKWVENVGYQKNISGKEIEAGAKNINVILARQQVLQCFTSDLTIFILW